mmetsp:Transcript_69936/g.197303  ORF Transcript_69936/g.197303 Transcript_69936/m.197303 type:complete len:338 (+) Transcript_69936:2605-3618(+)
MEEVQDAGKSGPALPTAKSRPRKWLLLSCLTLSSSSTKGRSLSRYAALGSGRTNRSPSSRLSDRRGLKMPLSRLASSSSPSEAPPSASSDQNSLPFTTLPDRGRSTRFGSSTLNLSRLRSTPLPSLPSMASPAPGRRAPPRTAFPTAVCASADVGTMNCPCATCVPASTIFMEMFPPYSGAILSCDSETASTAPALDSTRVLVMLFARRAICWAKFAASVFWCRTCMGCVCITPMFSVESCAGRFRRKRSSPNWTPPYTLRVLVQMPSCEATISPSCRRTSERQWSLQSFGISRRQPAAASFTADHSTRLNQESSSSRWVASMSFARSEALASSRRW